MTHKYSESELDKILNKKIPWYIRYGNIIALLFIASLLIILYYTIEYKY